ncbi:MAG: sugar phosphate isomerase/epimerase [Oscillospiraceae bacterium]|nr:sugar phosphate isomerase/epimerase [Oscillospiraceae bacterium]
MTFKLSAFADEAADALSEQIEALQTEGIRWLELRGADGINIGDITPVQAREIRRNLGEGGITVSALGSPYGKIKITDDFAAHLDKFKRTLEVAHILDAPYMRMFSFYLDGRTHADAKAQVIDQIGQLLDAAAGSGVVCCHENEKGIYGDTDGYCAELMEAFGGRLGCVYDPANFLQCGVAAWPAFERLLPYTTYYHMKDVESANGSVGQAGGCVVPAGDGDGEIVRILRTLKDQPGETFLSLEPHLWQFTGLAALEEDRGEGLKHKYRFASGRESFAAAASALKGCLGEAGYRSNGEVWA